MAQVNDTLEYIFETFSPVKGKKLPYIINDIDRASIPQAMGEMGFKVGAEVGVAQGIHAQTLCESIPGLKLYCVDVWERYKGYLEYTNRIRQYHRQALRVLEPYDCEFIKKFSMDAVTDFEDRSLDFVYIDAAHDMKNVACDLWEWSKKVRYGGIVFGHDYKFYDGVTNKYTVHVRHTVQCYCYVKHIDPWFEVKIPREASWMFVRQEGDLV